jgi:hypothetical protein
MDFLYTQQISEADMARESYDLFFTVAGTSERCDHLIKNHNITANKKICLILSDSKKELFKKTNEDSFLNAGFEMIKLHSSEISKIHNILDELLKSSNSNEQRILVDYSCMAKTWYATFINYFFETEHNFDAIQLFFAYSPTLFQKERKIRNFKILKEDLEQINNSNSKPKVLLLSLGTEIGGADQLIKLMNPEQIIIMYADPAIDPAYVKRVFTNNRKLINSTEPRNLINYPLLRIDEMNQILTSKCIELRIDYNVVIAPLGPKIFTLNSFILMAQYPDIFVLKSSLGITKNKAGVKPSGEILVQKTVFSNLEEE